MPCISHRVLQHTAATSHIEKPNTLSGRRVVHERQMRRATYWHNRGSNLVDYTFCVLILPCLYFSGDTRHEIQKGLNPLQCKEFRHKMTPPVLNNDKRLFKLGGVIHLVDPIGIEPTTLRMRTVRSPKCDIARARIFVHSNLFKIGLGGMRIIRLPQEMRMIRGELPNHSHLFYWQQI